MSALQGLTDAELFAALNGDFDSLDSGAWLPDTDSIDACRDVLAEIETRLNSRPIPRAVNQKIEYLKILKPE